MLDGSRLYHSHGPIVTASPQILGDGLGLRLGLGLELGLEAAAKVALPVKANPFSLPVNLGCLEKGAGH